MTEGRADRAVPAALNSASVDASFTPRPKIFMRTTITLDDDLAAKAERLTGLRDKTMLVREALQALIERESARRLARLGGSDPQSKAPPRRRP
jgi:Arc/MetJ family transcription regulator